MNYDLMRGLFCGSQRDAIIQRLCLDRLAVDQAGGLSVGDDTDLQIDWRIAGS
mgnify:CR=1 FL=1